MNQMPDDITIGMAKGVQAYVRGAGSVVPDFELLRQRLQSMSHGLVAYDDKSLQGLVLSTVATQRFTMALLASFAALALFLASIGIYGVLSYLVGQRTREIGIRIALGASRKDVLGMVLAEGSRMTLVGLAIGIAGALALTRLMSTMLFGVSATDLSTFLLVAVTLSSIAIFACYVPARRAMKIDPLEALRDE
jgi:putative ABC transport system permease protein